MLSTLNLQCHNSSPLQSPTCANISHGAVSQDPPAPYLFGTSHPSLDDTEEMSAQLTELSLWASGPADLSRPRDSGSTFSPNLSATPTANCASPSQWYLNSTPATPVDVVRLQGSSRKRKSRITPPSTPQRTPDPYSCLTTVQRAILLYVQHSGPSPSPYHSILSRAGRDVGWNGVDVADISMAIEARYGLSGTDIR
jgi:hypothetical protein